jgi:hypothetical protein
VVEARIFHRLLEMVLISHSGQSFFCAHMTGPSTSGSTHRSNYLPFGCMVPIPKTLVAFSWHFVNHATSDGWYSDLLGRFFIIAGLVIMSSHLGPALVTNSE